MRTIAACLILAACGAAPTPAPQPPPRSPVAGQAAPAPEPTPGPAPTPAPAGDAATPLEAALLHGHPTPDTFDQLHAVIGTLPAARQSALRARGATTDAPIHVPSIKFEYVWVRAFACGQGEGKVDIQALVKGPHGPLDELEFTCPGSSETRHTYFDYSDDPAEKAMDKELGLPR